MGYEIWDMGYGIWDMRYGIWDMRYEIWDMGYGIYSGAVGSCFELSIDMRICIQVQEGRQRVRALTVVPSVRPQCQAGVGLRPRLRLGLGRGVE